MTPLYIVVASMIRSRPIMPDGSFTRFCTPTTREEADSISARLVEGSADARVIRADEPMPPAPLHNIVTKTLQDVADYLGRAPHSPDEAAAAREELDSEPGPARFSQAQARALAAVLHPASVLPASEPERPNTSPSNTSPSNTMPNTAPNTAPNTSTVDELYADLLNTLPQIISEVGDPFSDEFPQGDEMTNQYDDLQFDADAATKADPPGITVPPIDNCGCIGYAAVQDLGKAQYPIQIGRKGFPSSVVFEPAVFNTKSTPNGVQYAEVTRARIVPQYVGENRRRELPAPSQESLELAMRLRTEQRVYRTEEELQQSWAAQIQALVDANTGFADVVSIRPIRLNTSNTNKEI